MTKQIFIFLFPLVLFFQCGSQSSQKQTVITGVELRKVCALPIELHETSGILFFNGLVWTFNDSGNSAVLFGLDTTNSDIKHEIFLQGAKNIDWESIAQDSLYIYIGDIGNNGTQRQNFQIYRIPKDSIAFAKEQLLIGFDRIDFSFDDKDSDFLLNFDAEAMLIQNEVVLLYTKDWQNYKTTVIEIPNILGVHHAKKLKKYNIQGLVTSAAHVEDKNEIYLLGYSDYVPFISKLKADKKLKKVLGSTRFDLPEYRGMQTEAITFENGQYFISCESSNYEQSLYELIFK